MNELESKLRSLTFRPPPPGWRAAMVTSAASSSPSGWRRWLAPHPAAWGALAALWLILGLASKILDEPDSIRPAMVVEVSRDPLSEPTLLAFHLRSQAVLQ